MSAVTPRILGTGYASPSTIRTNDDPIFDWLKKNNPAGMDLFSGYDKRHILAPDQTLIDIMKPAAELALKDAEVTVGQIDLALGEGSMGEYLTPNTLSELHHALGIREHAWPIPLANTYSQFNAAVMLADALIRAGRASYVLIAVGDNWSRYVSYFTPQSISAADGAAAVVMGPEKTASDWEYVDQLTVTDTSYYGSMFMAGKSMPVALSGDPAVPTVSSHPYFQITEKGLEGFKEFGLKTAPRAVTDLLKRHPEIDSADVCLITHQASSKLMDSWERTICPGYYVNTIDKFANMVLANVPFNLAWGMQNAKVDFVQDWLVTLCLGPDMHANAMLMRRN